MNPENGRSDRLVDYITGKSIPDVGAEQNRQMVEKLLVEIKGYAKAEIEVDVPIMLEMANETYCSTVDIVVSVEGRRLMVIKCAAGSLGSREREVIAAARLLDKYQVPLSVACDGRNALVWDTVSARLTGQGLESIPDRKEAQAGLATARRIPLAPERRLRQQLIFRSYDNMNINVAGRAAETT